MMTARQLRSHVPPLPKVAEMPVLTSGHQGGSCFEISHRSLDRDAHYYAQPVSLTASYEIVRCFAASSGLFHRFSTRPECRQCSHEILVLELQMCSPHDHRQTLNRICLSWLYQQPASLCDKFHEFVKVQNSPHYWKPPVPMRSEDPL